MTYDDFCAAALPVDGDVKGPIKCTLPRGHHGTHELRVTWPDRCGAEIIVVNLAGDQVPFFCMEAPYHPAGQHKGSDDHLNTLSWAWQ